ncbi:MAG: HyaD/HybD family hydrogenase maturation endopeptidase [Spirochaetes bacterium]|jgi:hydrogenase maturation protease|nr:HyaD/HybD family hydrogenase maturation endopeptidase [Spirochaetota bacterium]
MTKRILILGVGNILHYDDGIGVHVVNRIQESGIDIPDDVEIIDGGTAGFDLIPLMQGRSKIVIVDALKVDDAPGSIYRFRPESLADDRKVFSLHEFGIKKIIDTLRIMGEAPEVEIIGIVPQDITTLDIGLSSAVMESIPKAIEQILKAVSQ